MSIGRSLVIRPLLHLKDCTKIQKMKLRDTVITSQGLQEIGRFTELTHLDLSETKTGDAAMEVVGKLPKLVISIFGRRK